MLTLARIALALLLAAGVGFTSGPAPVSARMLFESVGLVPGLPAGTANSDGTLSIPAKAAPAGSTVTFYIEGAVVGTAIAATDGSATLAKPLYPAGAGAAFQYGAVKTSPVVAAPTPVIPAFPTIGNVLPAPNALTAAPWLGSVGGDALTAPTATTTRWVQSTADTSNRSLYQNPLALPAGQYTFGATIIRNTASSDSYLRAFNGYGTASFPASASDITTGTPYRTKVTFTSDGNGSFYSLNKPAGLSASDYTIYNVSITPGATDPYVAGDAPATVPLPATDYAGQFLTTTNWPTQLPPAVAGTLPSGNLRLQAGATNLVAMDFSSNGNVKDRATFDSMTFPAAITGNLATVIGEGGSAPNYNAVDGANATKSYARYRRFPPGHPYNLHTFIPEGLKLGVVGAKNNQSPYKGPASGSSVQVYAGGFRLEQPILPGMTVERVVKFGSNPFSWNCVWMFNGVQISPARYAIAKSMPSVANNPYAFGANQAGALVYTARHTVNGTTKSPYYEVDDHDAWWSQPLGDYLQGMPAGVVRPDDATDSDALVVPPYTYFLPGDNGFGFTAGTGQKYAKLLATLNDGQFHSIVVNWPDDGKDRIQFIIDGKLFMEQHFEYLMDTYTDPLTGTVQKVGMHLLIGGQSIPGFVPGADTGSLSITDRDSLAMVVKSVKVWKGNLDESTIVKPTNALSTTYGALASTTTTGSTGSATTLAITGMQASGTKLTATANDGTAMTVSGANVSGTFTSAGTKTIAVTEHPYAAKGIGLGVPRTTNLTVTIAAPADLQNLAITPTSVNVGMPYTGTVSPTASGSTVAVASNDNITLTMSGTGTSRTAKGTFYTAGTPSLTPTETLAGSSNSPKTSPASTLNVLADSPTGANLITTPNDPAYWSSSTLTFTTGQSDSTGGTAAYNAIPTTTNGLHRMSKTVTGLTVGQPYRISFTLKPFGTGPGSRYYMINAGSMGQVTFDLQTLTATTSTTGPNTTVPPGGYFISSAGSGFYKVSIQGTATATSQNILPALMNGLSTDDTSSAGLFAGDGTSGITVYNARVGVP